MRLFQLLLAFVRDEDRGETEKMLVAGKAVVAPASFRKDMSARTTRTVMPQSSSKAPTKTTFLRLASTTSLLVGLCTRGRRQSADGPKNNACLKGYGVSPSIHRSHPELCKPRSVCRLGKN